MNARPHAAGPSLTAAIAVAVAIAVGMAGVGCASPTSTAADPDLRSRGAEAPVAVTTPGGAESLPAWKREGGRSTLTVPADLLFAIDSAELEPAAAEALGQVVDEVRSLPGSAAEVLVEGHADADGDADHNQELSARRAAAVADRLTEEGVAPSTITTRGWGETRPVARGTDDAAKSENRRVVITISQSPGTHMPATEKEGTR